MAKQAVVLVPAIPVTAPRIERTMSMAALKAQVLSPFVSVETAVVGVRQVDVVVRVTGVRIQVPAIAIFARMIQQKVPLQIAPETLIRMTPVEMSRISRFANFFFNLYSTLFARALGCRSVYVYVLWGLFATRTPASLVCLASGVWTAQPHASFYFIFSLQHFGNGASWIAARHFVRQGSWPANRPSL